jgi:pyruvate dehydrogenase E2 component (dihydrolipoamide acetyltransferase)
MQEAVPLPKLGDTTQVALLTEWLCAVGDAVEVGTPIAVFETDKVSTEVESPIAGTVVELLAAVDEEVAVGAPICIVDS